MKKKDRKPGERLDSFEINMVSLVEGINNIYFLIYKYVYFKYCILSYTKCVKISTNGSILTAHCTFYM